jgi:hypothetical protein
LLRFSIKWSCASIDVEARNTPFLRKNSLSPEILAHVLDYETLAKVWSTIMSMFSYVSKSKVSHLRAALNNTKKDMTVAQYSTTIKGFVSELAVVGKLLMMMSLKDMCLMD